MKTILLVLLIQFTFSAIEGIASNVTSKNTSLNSTSRKKVYCLKIVAFDTFSKQYLSNWKFVVRDLKNIVITQGNVSNEMIYISNLRSETYQIDAFYCGKVFDKIIVSRHVLKQSDTLIVIFKYTDSTFLISGKAIDCTTQKPFRNKEVVITEFDKKEQIKVTTDSNGFFYARTFNHYNYHILLNADSCFPLLENVYLADKNRLTTYCVSTEICAYRIECNREIRIPFVAIDLDHGRIVKGEGRQPELDKLVDILRKNPSFKIEIMAHSDCRSNADYNLDATQRLADEIKAYIVSKGIDANRLIARGFGESQLLNHCNCTDGIKCSEIEHAVNRRRMFKLICEM